MDKPKNFLMDEMVTWLSKTYAFMGGDDVHQKIERFTETGIKIMGLRYIPTFQDLSVFQDLSETHSIRYMNHQMFLQRINTKEFDYLKFKATCIESNRTSTTLKNFRIKIYPIDINQTMYTMPRVNLTKKICKKKTQNWRFQG